MTYIFGSCPRCGDKNTTFYVTASNDISYINNFRSWQEIEEFTSPEDRCSMYELSAVCKKCRKTSILIVSEPFDYKEFEPIKRDNPTKIDGSLDHLFEFKGYVLSRDTEMYPPPNAIPKDIKFFFQEGTACLSNECWNPAGTMFRTCLELVVEYQLTKEDLKELKKAKKTDLFDKINKLSQDRKLSDDLTSIATFIREDGNKSTHGSLILTKDDAMELLDFTSILLENVYTIPAKIKNSEERREERKAKAERKKQLTTNN